MYTNPNFGYVFLRILFTIHTKYDFSVYTRTLVTKPVMNTVLFLKF